jgi:GT2 family glycosyltransferase
MGVRPAFLVGGPPQDKLQFGSSPLMTIESKVSVVMSVFNGERHLHAALDSILDQKGLAFEFVVVDDGSTDGTPDILNRYARADPRIRVLRQENAGLTKALIRGCREAKGEFIARQDVDDLSLPGRLARQQALLAADPSLAMVSCGVGHIGPAEEHLFDHAGSSDADKATLDLLDNFCGPVHGSVMFRRSAYEMSGGYRWQFYFAQDSDLWLRIAEIGRIAYLPERLYLYRITESSIGSRWGVTQARLGNLSHVCRRARSQGLSEDQTLAAAQLLRPGLIPPAQSDPKGAAGLWFLSRCLLSKADRRGLKYASRYVARRPLDAKGWLSLVWGFLFAWHDGACNDVGGLGPVGQHDGSGVEGARTSKAVD